MQGIKRNFKKIILIFKNLMIEADCVIEIIIFKFKIIFTYYFLVISDIYHAY